MELLRVKQLGLAAYIKMHGVDLIGVEERTFIFNSTKTIDDWRTAYANSCCIRHDSLVCELRHFIK